MAITFERIVPKLRMFSVEKAREFYLDFLDFKIDWEHRFEKTAPLYMQVSRGTIALHLSEHFGDGVPGAAVYIYMKGLDEFHRALTAKNYRHARPGILDQTWGMREILLTDPSGNKLCFGEAKYEGA